MKERLSIYFPAGDFTEALRRHQDGEAQSYATHDEVAKLLLGLADEGFDVTAYSLITPSAKTNTPAERVRIVDVGSNRFDDPRLTELFRQDRAGLAVIHFPHLGLLGAGSEMKGRAFPVLASSYNRRGLRPWLERKRLAGLLNRPKFTWVSNHCLPATRHLADLGVKADRLIPWDVPHPTSPSMSDVKKGNDSAPFRLAYAGSMIASKGVGDVLEAVALLNASGLDVQCELAGGGEIDRFRSLAQKRGIASKITFLGVIGNDKVVEMFRNADAVGFRAGRCSRKGSPSLCLKRSPPAHPSSAATIRCSSQSSRIGAQPWSIRRESPGRSPKKSGNCPAIRTCRKPCPATPT